MELTVSGQLISFLCATALGAGLGFFYDVFRILRIAIPHKSLAVAAEDIFFWTAAAFVTFLFFFCSDKGRIRLFLLAGEGIGFVLWYFTMGILLVGAAKKVIMVIAWISHWIYRIFIYPIVLVIGYVVGFLKGIGQWIFKPIKKHVKNSNMPLPKYCRLLYNQRELFKNWLHSRRCP